MFSSSTVAARLQTPRTQPSTSIKSHKPLHRTLLQRDFQRCSDRIRRLLSVSLVGSLFSGSNGEQKARMVNQLISSIGPGTVAQLAGGGMLASLLGGGAGAITPEQAQNVSPEVVQQIAAHAEKADPSIIDKASAFYAQHPGLVKTLGGAALSVALAKVAERQRAA